MRIDRPQDAGRRPVERRSASEGPKRPENRVRARDGESVGETADRVETAAAEVLTRLVERVQRRLSERHDDVLSRRDELLARAHDPESLRRAARRLLGLVDDGRAP